MTTTVHGVFGAGELTTESSMSSYGCPVLVLDGVTYGSSDPIDCGCGEETWVEPASSAVARATVIYPDCPHGDECVVHDASFGDLPGYEAASDEDVARWHDICRSMTQMRNTFVAGTLRPRES